HSTAVTAPMRPPPDIVDAFVWQPIAELPAREVFAFGRPWDDLASGLGLPRTRALGPGGRDYGSTVPTRVVHGYALPAGQRRTATSVVPPTLVRTRPASLVSRLIRPLPVRHL